MSPFDGRAGAGEHLRVAREKAKTVGTAQVPSQAIEEWANRVAQSSSLVWGDTYDTLTELERRVVTVVHNAAITLRMVREGLADQRDLIWLEKLASAKEDRPDTLKYVLGAQIVAECAERNVPALRDAGRPDLVDWGQLCKGMLASEVHVAFEKLKVADIDTLLARHTSTKNRRGGRLTAAGILVELNALAQHPFGRDFSAKKVTDAMGRAQR